MPTEPGRGQIRGTETGGPQATGPTTPGTGQGGGPGTEPEVEGYRLEQQPAMAANLGGEGQMGEGRMAARQAAPPADADRADRADG